MKNVLGSLVFFAMLWACSSDNGTAPEPPASGNPEPTPPQEVSFERSAMLENWADNIIIPSYEAFEATLVDLTTAFGNFKGDASSANLNLLREAWLTAYTNWQRISMFEIGPAEALDFRLNMNIYPTDVAKIEELIASGSYDLSLPSNRVAKGFPALDYLLNGLATTDEAIVSKFNGENKVELLAYIDAILMDMSTRTNSILSDWKTSYRDTFVSNDGASATASVDRFVNDYIFYYEKFLRAGKMGIPLGVFSGSPLPGNVEAFFEPEISNALFLEGLEAVQDFFNGKHYASSGSGESLASYLDALNTLKDGEDLNSVINAQLDKAREMVESLDAFRNEIENNSPPTDMLLAYDEVQRAVPLLKVDMVSAMSINIDFVDADGD